MRTDMSKWKRRIMAFLTAFLIMLCAAGTEALQVQADEKTASGNDESGGETTDTEEDDEDPGPSSTSEFLSLSDTYQTPTVTYGETAGGELQFRTAEGCHRETEDIQSGLRMAL